MPELPEVQTIVSDFIPILPGLSITKASYVGSLGTDLLRKSQVDLSVSLPGKKITSVRRISKEIVLDLDSGEVLDFHLKITGRLLIRNPKDKEDEFTRLVITLSSGQELRFTDRNGFADARLLSISEADSRREQYGPEIISHDLTAERLRFLVSSSKEPSLKETLLNQKIISGMGNIYVDEALFLAKLHPSLKPIQLTEDEAEKLLSASRQVLEEGLKDRGTTIDSYLDAFGKPGHHQDNLRVYGKTGQPCPEGNGTIEYKEVGGRRTFYCPECQKLPQLSLF